MSILLTSENQTNIVIEPNLNVHAHPIEYYVNENGCHICISHRNDGSGYHSIYRNGKNTKVHRVVWENKNGLIPDGLFVLHSCDNPECCNLDHLRLGTHADNMRDRNIRNRTARGPRIGRAKLIEKDVFEILDRLAKGESCTSIAREYAVNPKAINNIKLGKTWKHVIEIWTANILLAA